MGERRGQPISTVARWIVSRAVVSFDRELAVWFAQPHGLLRYAAPGDAIARDAAAVFSPARAERFVARG